MGYLIIIKNAANLFPNRSFAELASFMFDSISEPVKSSLKLSYGNRSDALLADAVFQMRDLAK
jgi:hypothetical protein